MSELLIELFSEEMPPNLQINARNQFESLLKEELKTLSLKFDSIQAFSTPTRITILIPDLPKKIKILPYEAKGPKFGVPQDVIKNFAKS